jgi:hypothetical protein
MRVHVDESRGDDSLRRIDRCRPAQPEIRANFADAPVFHADVGAKPRRSGAIDHVSALQQPMRSLLRVPAVGHGRGSASTDID